MSVSISLASFISADFVGLFEFYSNTFDLAEVVELHSDIFRGAENEIITRDILDGEVIDFAGEDGRLPEAGEVPSVPVHSPAPPRRQNRSTVLDDKHGRRRASAG